MLVCPGLALRRTIYVLIYFTAVSVKRYVYSLLNKIWQILTAEKCSRELKFWTNVHAIDVGFQVLWFFLYDYWNLHEQPLISFTFSFAVTADIAIAASITYYLHKSRSGIKGYVWYLSLWHTPHYSPLERTPPLINWWHLPLITDYWRGERNV